MERMACLASPESAVPRLHQRQNCCPEFQNSARAKLHRETLAVQAPRVRTARQATQAHQELMANQEIRDHEDLLDHLAHLALQARRDHPATLARSVERTQVHLVHLDLPARQAHPALQADPASQAKMAIQAILAQLAMLVLQAAPANLAAPAVQEMPASPVHPAAATTAHQLVWLQATKHSNQQNELQFNLPPEPSRRKRLFQNTQPWQFETITVLSLYKRSFVVS